MTETDGRWRHASGDDKDGCGACQTEAVNALLNGDDPMPGCFDPGDDGDGFCPVCGHHTERVA